MDIPTHTQDGLSQAQEILIEEVEQLMEDVAPNEADTAALYVETPESFLAKGSDERAFGIPGAGFAALVGPLLVKFVVLIAKSFSEHLLNKGAETAATAFLARLMRAFRLGPTQEPVRKEKTVATITTALIEAGWDAGRAGKAAEKVWQSGVTAGERLAAIN